MNISSSTEHSYTHYSFQVMLNGEKSKKASKPEMNKIEIFALGFVKLEKS